MAKLKILAICVLLLFVGNTYANRIFRDSINEPISIGVWDTVTLNFNGPYHINTDEDPNPFLDYRLQVHFFGPIGYYNVPGYFAGDGNGGNGGSVWQVKFTPDREGEWVYYVEFCYGENVAINGCGTVGYCNGETGSITVYSNPRASGFLSKGRLVNDTSHTKVGGSYYGYHFWGRDGSPYILEDHVILEPESELLIAGGVVVMFKDGSMLKSNGGKLDARDNVSFITYDERLLSSKSFYFKTLGDNKYWIKGGTDSPEDFLAHTFAPHGSVYGALDYLSSRNVNSIFALLMNLGGDGNNVHPFINDIYHYDTTKLNEWSNIFYYAQTKGIALQLVFNEGEKANKELLGKDNLTLERKLYYREMVARFSYNNAVIWNLCEEYDHHCTDCPIAPDVIRTWAQYLRDIDPYQHPITVHNWATEEGYTGVDGFDPFWGDNRFGCVSIQYRPPADYDNYSTYGEKVELLRDKAKISNLKIPICMDETFGTVASYGGCYDLPMVKCGYDGIRREVIYPTYFSGGNLELFLDTNIDTDNFYVYEIIWNYMWYARKVIEELSFWDMGPNHNLVNGTSDRELCFTNGHHYAIYLPYGGRSYINISTPSNFTKRWYDPKIGEYYGSEVVISGGGTIDMGNPPYAGDWVIILKEQGY